MRCFWRVISNATDDSKVFLDRPSIIDDELFRLAVNAVGSKQVASFAVQKLLPLLSAGQVKEATQIVIENFEQYKKERKK